MKRAMGIGSDGFAPSEAFRKMLWKMLLTPAQISCDYCTGIMQAVLVIVRFIGAYRTPDGFISIPNQQGGLL
jgi:hypothetical protein